MSHETNKKTRIRGLLAATALGASLFAVPVLSPYVTQITPAYAQSQPLGEQVQEMSRAPLSFASIVKKVSPAVVSVQVSVERPLAADRPGMPNMPQFRDLPDDHPFNEFFKRFFDDRGQRGQGGDDNNRRGGPRGRFGMAQGSGFIISADGYVVTNNHVVDSAARVELTLTDGSEYEAEVIGTDSKTDLALLKIKSDKEFPFVAFASQDIEIGDWVVAVGNPFGLGGSVTAGIVSARGRDIGSGPYDDFIQIDASINKGNSGGPAFNLDGQVVGVNTAIFSPSGGSVGIGFAIPANVVQDVVAQLKDSGAVTRGWLGVQIQTVTDDLAQGLGLDKAHGAIVSQLTDGSPGGKAGIKTGDTILKVNGNEVEDARDLARKIGRLSPNAKTDIEVLRDGERKTISVTLGTQPDQVSAKVDAPDSKTTEFDSFGLQLAPAADVPGAEGDGVVVVGVKDDSEAASKGLQVGDTILEVAGKVVKTPEDVSAGIKAAKDKDRKAVLMRVQSGERQRFVALSTAKAS